MEEALRWVAAGNSRDPACNAVRTDAGARPNDGDFNEIVDPALDSSCPGGGAARRSCQRAGRRSSAFRAIQGAWHRPRCDGLVPGTAERPDCTAWRQSAFLRNACDARCPDRERTFPLILLSHGAGLAGSAQALSWMATALAERGFVVAAPTHPGNTGANRSAAETMKLWLRPADLTATLNAMEKEAFFGDHLAQGEIGALGLSMGGNTVLAMAGARMDPKLLAGYCDTDLLNPSLCGGSGKAASTFTPWTCNPPVVTTKTGAFDLPWRSIPPRQISSTSRVSPASQSRLV